MSAATLVARHQVKDYSTWRSVYDSLEGFRQRHNCYGAEVMIDPASKNDIFIIHRFPTLESAQAFAGSSELKEAMSRAGVTGTPRIEIAVSP